jgi:hypothetical protein
MTEDFLHYLWRFVRLKPGPWVSTTGNTIALIHPGFLNSDSGPDFSTAQISINGRTWAGNLEIHLRASDWFRHKHQHDPAYNGIILHVVYDDDKAVFCENGQGPETLCLRGLIDEQLYWNFEQKLRSKKPIICAHFFKETASIRKVQMLERCGVSRLQKKAEELEIIWQELHGNWEAILYRIQAKALGAKVNGPAMEVLSRIVPWSLWKKYIDRPQSLQALFLGMASLLNSNDAVGAALGKEFEYLKHKHQLEPMEWSIWKYARMRPANFPERRIIQLTKLLASNVAWIKMIRNESRQEFDGLNWPPLDLYWDTHYRLAKKNNRSMGVKWSVSLQNQLYINVLVPLIVLYGLKSGKNNWQNRALSILEQLPPESNAVTRNFEDLGLQLLSSFHSQACIAWFEDYCRPKKCLNCALGSQLLNG